MESERLLLQRPDEPDFDRFFEIQSDPQTNLFNPEGPMDYQKATREFAKMRNHWSSKGFGQWTIQEKASGRIIGFGGLSHRLYGKEIKVNLGYRFSTESWGSGFATELATAAIAFGFEELKLAEIWAVVRPDHAVSIRVLEKCGMKPAGTLDDVACGPQSLVFSIAQPKS